MTHSLFETPAPFLTKARQNDIPVMLLLEKQSETWVKTQPEHIRHLIADSSFFSKGPQTLIIRNKDGEIEKILSKTKDDPSIYDFAHPVEFLAKNLSPAFLTKASFNFEAKGLSDESLANACIGWGLACYRYDSYKKSDLPIPKLIWPKSVDKKRVKALMSSISLLRNLINAPANALGPEEIEKAALTVAADYEARITITKGKALEKDFPLIHAVGDSSPRRPRLIDLRWGSPKDPKVTLVGKGVCFDTGGLDLKPSQYMRLMKKDMGGAAHALALGRIIMALGLKINLRILIPAVENSVSGSAFRPGDIFKSRKGLTVENTNTDAEGRLILADTLTLASEDKPDLIIDFATLTGSARAALGPDIPAMFSNNDTLAEKLVKHAFEIDDPLWRMPLWAPYTKTIESPVADLINSASVPGDLIYSALFLQSFLVETPNWMHLDVFAWEQSGRPGRPAGGAETGLRAVLAFLEDHYG